MCGFFIILIAKELQYFKVKEFMHFVKQETLKAKLNPKWKIPHTVLERRTLCFSSYKNRKLKVKLWWAGARKRKKRAFSVLFFFSEWNFFNIYVLSQCIVHWRDFSEYTYFYITKNITSYTFLLVFKIVESLQCVLNTFFILIFFAPLAKSVSTVCYIYWPIHSKC